MSNTIPVDLIEELKRYADEQTFTEANDEFIPCDAFGGNYDDAYDGGIGDGKILLARRILAALKA